MKLPHSAVTYALVGAMVLALSACGATNTATQSTSQTATSAANSTTTPVASATAASSPAAAADSNMFGGPIYSGQPALAATAALIDAGGGAQHFSFQTALVSMLGEDTVNAEVAKLTKQYSADDVTGFIGSYVNVSGLSAAGVAAVSVPSPVSELARPPLAR